MAFSSLSNITDQCISFYLVKFHLFFIKNNSFGWYRLSFLWIRRTYFLLVLTPWCLSNRCDFISKILRVRLTFSGPWKFMDPMTWKPWEMPVHLNRPAWPQLSLGHSVPVISFLKSLITPYILCESSLREFSIQHLHRRPFLLIPVPFLCCLSVCCNPGYPQTCLTANGHKLW